MKKEGTPMEMNNYDFCDWAKQFFTDEEWERLCDLLNGENEWWN